MSVRTHVARACSGYLAYEKIVEQLLDADYMAMYSPAGVDNTQVGGAGWWWW
jgi:hypothetical protein